MSTLTIIIFIAIPILGMIIFVVDTQMWEDILKHSKSEQEEQK